MNLNAIQTTVGRLVFGYLHWLAFNLCTNTHIDRNTLVIRNVAQIFISYCKSLRRKQRREMVKCKRSTGWNEAYR